MPLVVEQFAPEAGDGAGILLGPTRPRAQEDKSEENWPEVRRQKRWPEPVSQGCGFDEHRCRRHHLTPGFGPVASTSAGCTDARTTPSSGEPKVRATPHPFRASGSSCPPRHGQVLSRILYGDRPINLQQYRDDEHGPCGRMARTNLEEHHVLTKFRPNPTDGVFGTTMPLFDRSSAHNCTR